MSHEQTDERSRACVALPVSIGRASRSDCNEIAALEETVFVADGYGEKEVRQFLERFPALCLAAREGVDGRLAGYALCGGRAGARHKIVDETGWLNSLAVREDLRGVDWARDCSAPRWRLWVTRVLSGRCSTPKGRISTPSAFTEVAGSSTPSTRTLPARSG